MIRETNHAALSCTGTIAAVAPLGAEASSRGRRAGLRRPWATTTPLPCSWPTPSPPAPRIVHATGDGTGREMRALRTTPSRACSRSTQEAIAGRSVDAAPAAVEHLPAGDRYRQRRTRHRRHRRVVSGQHQPGRLLRPGSGAGSARGRNAFGPRIHPVSSDRFRRAVAADAAVDRGRARRRRHADRRYRAALLGGPARRRTGAPRHRRARGLAPPCRGTSRLPRRADPSRRGICKTLSSDLGILQIGRHRSRHRSDSGAADPVARPGHAARPARHRTRHPRPLSARQRQRRGL
jgi:hypothetical protein